MTSKAESGNTNQFRGVIKHCLLQTACVLGVVLSVTSWQVAEAAGVSKDLPYPDSPPDARQVAEQVYFVNRFFSFANASLEDHPRGVAEIVNWKPGRKPTFWTVERHVNNTYADGVIRSREFAVFRSGKMKGAAILLTEYEDEARDPEYAIWLPALRRLRTLVEHDKEKSWGGTVFTFGEMSLRKPEDEHHRLAGVVRFDRCLSSLLMPEDQTPQGLRSKLHPVCDHRDKQVYVLISEPRDTNWYDYRVSFVDVDSFADYRTEYHRNGKKVKVVDRDWRPASLNDKRALLWHHMYGKNLITGFETYIAVPEQSLAINTDKRPGFWSIESLKGVKLK
jgi:hypothetical protein